MEKGNIVFGIRPVAESIESGKQIEKIYVRRGAEGQLMTDLRDLCYRHIVLNRYFHLKWLHYS